VPEDAGVIVRTAAEGASEEQLSADVAAPGGEAVGEIRPRSRGSQEGEGAGPAARRARPGHRVVRDIFNEDFTQLIVVRRRQAQIIEEYIGWVAPDLATACAGGDDCATCSRTHRIDEQITKALDRKVWLPSGGSLVIDRTEAMTVVDVNTGKFVGQGGNLEETVTRNNLEAAEEIVRQLRLRDIGGIIVVDFIDMVLESNRDLVVRRLVECLGRDRTKHQVAEVTSLGLVQMTRKRIGSRAARGPSRAL
jgi:ribonuclease E